MTITRNLALLLLILSSVYSCHKGQNCKHGTYNNGGCDCDSGYFGADCDTAYSHRYVGAYKGVTILSNGDSIHDTLYLQEELPPYGVKIFLKSSMDTMHTNVWSFVEVGQPVYTPVTDSVTGSVIVNLYTWPHVRLLVTFIKQKNGTITDTYYFNSKRE